MSRSLSDAAVVRELAEQICRRLTRRMIATLQKMNNGLLSGDDSGLKNAWDEICAQLKFEESFSWDVYDETVRGLAASDIERLLPYVYSEACNWSNRRIRTYLDRRSGD
jgi:hypothetical protein